MSDEQRNPAVEAMNRLAGRRIAAGYATEEVTIRAELITAVREAIYDTDRDRNPTVETAETGPRWSLEPDYRQEDYDAMAQAAVDTFIAFISKPREPRAHFPAYGT